MNSDGSLKHLLKCEHGGTLFMDGKEVFRKAVRVVVESAERAMADAGLGPDDISLMVPHQANLRIIQAACQRLGIPEERTVVVIDRYGNTSSASIPLALHDALDQRPRARRRQPVADRVRRRHDLGQRGLPLERMSAAAGGAGLALVVLAAGRAKRYGGCKPLAPVGPHGEAVIDLVASDALAAGFETIVLVLGPSTGPAIRYHVEHTWPARGRRALRHPAGAARHRQRRAVRLRPRGRRALRRGQRRRHLRARRLRAAGRAPAGRHADTNALVGYRLADAVIGFSPVTRGICRVADDGHAPRGRRAAPGARARPTGGFVAGDGREPDRRCRPDARVSMNLWGFTPDFHKTLQAAMDAAADASEESEVLLPEVVAAVARHQLVHRAARPRAAASG